MAGRIIRAVEQIRGRLFPDEGAELLTLRVDEIIVDCSDPEAVAAWWVSFVPVPEPKRSRTASTGT